MTAVIGTLFMPETKDRNLNADYGEPQAAR